MRWKIKLAVAGATLFLGGSCCLCGGALLSRSPVAGWLTIETRARRAALACADRSASGEEVVRVDLSALGLDLIEVVGLHDEGVPGSFQSGAVAKYRWRGVDAAWVIAIKQNDPRGWEEDIGLARPDQPSKMEQALLEKYCPGASCHHVIALAAPGAWGRAQGSFVMVVVSGESPVLAIDVLDQVGAPRTAS